MQPHSIHTLARLLVRIARLRPPWHLALDRTDWRFGNTPINLLVLAIVTRRVRLPILFMVLDKAGSSSADECIRLMQAYLDILPAPPIFCAKSKGGGFLTCSFDLLQLFPFPAAFLLCVK